MRATFGAALLELSQKVGEAVWHALTDDVVVNCPELLADLGLNFASETRFSFSNCCSGYIHG